jgi:hypothetical protein
MGNFFGGGIRSLQLSRLSVAMSSARAMEGQFVWRSQFTWG